MLNYYSFGGPLILSGIRPYIDGRGDMYGDRFVLGYGDSSTVTKRPSTRQFTSLEYPMGDHGAPIRRNCIAMLR